MITAGFVRHKAQALRKETCMNVRGKLKQPINANTVQPTSCF